MTGEDTSGRPEHPDTGQSVRDIVGDLLADIQLGHIDDDVSHVLAERLSRAGFEMRPEEVEDLAEGIENHASR